MIDYTKLTDEELTQAVKDQLSSRFVEEVSWSLPTGGGESISLDKITDFIDSPAAWGWLMEREEITLSKVRLISLDWMAGYGPNKYTDPKPGRAVALAYLQAK